MDSTPSMPGPPKDQKAAEEALTKLLQEATAITSDRRTDMTRLDALRAAEQSVDAMLGPVADLKGDRFSGTPSPGRRASRVLTRLLIVTIIGVGSILAWQSYGEAAKKKLERWAPQVGWVRLGPGLKPSPGAGFVAERPSTAVVQESVPDSSQAASAAQTAPDIATPTAPAAPFPEVQVQQQLEAMARDLAALRQSVDQLTIGREQMARDIASLQAAEDVQYRNSAPPPKPTAAPPPKPTAAPAPKPLPKPPSQAAPKILAAPPPPALPPPLQTAPEISSAPTYPALPSVQPAPEISGAAPPPSRPPMPVPN